MPVFAPPATGALFEVLSAQADARPDAAALRFEGQRTSYRELCDRATRAAVRLWHEWNVRPGDRVAYLGFNHPDQLTLLFALARIGAVLAPLNVRLAPAEWETLLGDCGAGLILHDDTFREGAAALAVARVAEVRAIESLAAAGEPAGPAVPAHEAAEAPVLLVYTSGTTGKPKGALHTQANLLANMRIAVAVQGLGAADVVATMLPLFHVGGLCIQTLPALSAGAEVILHSRFDPAAALRSFSDERPTLTLQVPATLKALTEHAGWAASDLTSLRAVWAGSSTLPGSLIDAFNARGVPVCNVYGATETGPFSIALGEKEASGHAGSCGWPAPGVQARLLNPRDGVGEVLLRGANVVQRYWPARAALDAEGWFHSGDLASVAADGSYTIVGRAREMIISGGENIHPAEVENVLLAHPGVAECAVLGLPDARWGEVPVAVVVLQRVKRPDSAPYMDLLLSNWELTLREHLAARVARYKLPQRWFQLDALPRTALGKVQKERLREHITGDPQAGGRAREASQTSASTGSPSTAVATKKSA